MNSSEGETLRFAPTNESQSPSLYGQTCQRSAFEIKFLLDEKEAREVEKAVESQLAPDSHGDPLLGNAYRITSLYFDTPRFDIYRRTDGKVSTKYRVRRYASESLYYLECKTKRGQRVTKQRTPVPAEELAFLQDTFMENWPGNWFGSQLKLKQLRPVCKVTYDRIAFTGMNPTGPIRVTFDRSAVGLPVLGPVKEFFATPIGVRKGTTAGGLALLGDEVIVEFKFLDALPTLFKGVIETLRLSPRSGSKYRRCVDALGLLTERSAPCA